jgi:hypothetical protein
MLALIRFFHVVDGLPLWMWVMTALLSIYGVVLLWMDPNGADSALGALLLWQMLCASRGFVKPASAGYFDPILIHEPRWRIAIAHFVHASAAAGFAWALTGALELVLGASRPAAIEPGRLAAFLFVSAAAWAVSLGAPRLVGGALWIGVLVGLAVTPVGLKMFTAMTDRPEGPAQLLHALALALVCPFVMIDVALPMRPAVTAGLVIAVPLTFVLGASFIARRNYALESSS